MCYEGLRKQDWVLKNIPNRFNAQGMFNEKRGAKAVRF